MKSLKLKKINRRNRLIYHDNKIFLLTKVFISSNPSYVFVFHFLSYYFSFSRSSTISTDYVTILVMSSMKHYTVSGQVEGKQRLCASGRGYCLGNPCFHTALSSLCGSCEIRVEKFPLNSIEKRRPRLSRVRELISATLFLRFNDFSKPSMRNTLRKKIVAPRFFVRYCVHSYVVLKGIVFILVSLDFHVFYLFIYLFFYSIPCVHRNAN